jgi:hypothetical protein
MSQPSSASSSSESALPDVVREEFLLQKAAQHSRQRRFDLALQDCEELLHLDSSHPQALRIKACVSEAHQEWGKAAYGNTAFPQYVFVTLWPGTPTWRVWLGRLMIPCCGR